MGCIWSNESDRGRDWNYQNARNVTRAQQAVQPVRPRFGEYRCICGRTWSSRCSWQHAVQICMQCRRSVYPHSTRDLRPSDISKDRENAQEHQKELCQMCLQLGQYCGNIGKRERSRSRPRRLN